MINEVRIKQRIKKAISLKPSSVTLMRNEKVSNGMRGGKDSPVTVATFDGLLDDSSHNKVYKVTTDAGVYQNIGAIKFITVVEGFEIQTDDYFTLNGVKYRVTYPGMIFPGLYNAELEVN
ncbi:MAG: hypothetical protein AB6733_00250 [Clostridiaceae bacterium]